MVEAVFILCALTSLACAALLLRGWYASRSRLLLWSGLCFFGLMLNNVVLIIDKLVLPSVDFSFYTKLPAVVGLGLFLFGLIWEADG